MLVRYKHRCIYLLIDIIIVNYHLPLMFDCVICYLWTVGLIDYHSLLIVLCQYMFPLLRPFSLSLFQVRLHPPRLAGGWCHGHTTQLPCSWIQGLDYGLLEHAQGFLPLARNDTMLHHRRSISPSVVYGIAEIIMVQSAPPPSQFPAQTAVQLYSYSSTARWSNVQYYTSVCSTARWSTSVYWG